MEVKQAVEEEERVAPQEADQLSQRLFAPGFGGPGCGGPSCEGPGCRVKQAGPGCDRVKDPGVVKQAQGVVDQGVKDLAVVKQGVEDQAVVDLAEVDKYL